MTRDKEGFLAIVTFIAWLSLLVGIVGLVYAWRDGWMGGSGRFPGEERFQIAIVLAGLERFVAGAGLWALLLLGLGLAEDVGATGEKAEA